MLFFCILSTCIQLAVGGNQGRFIIWTKTSILSIGNLATSYHSHILLGGIPDWYLFNSGEDTCSQVFYYRRLAFNISHLYRNEDLPQLNRKRRNEQIIRTFLLSKDDFFILSVKRRLTSSSPRGSTCKTLSKRAESTCIRRYNRFNRLL
jgi:hypothetical protein